ncbi:MAG TPA: molybdate ABC transporter substrate-binding protein [bacterium]|nr:molybdate ABC transporter substrate-binding protein [bacterium]
MRRRLMILVTLLIIAGSAFGPAHAPGPRELHVAAASDLRFALEEIARLFERQQGVPVRLTFGSSGQLAAQIEQGAPFDVFFSANEGFVQALAGKGRVDRTSVQLYAIGRIVLWVRNDSPLDEGRGLSVLRDERIRFVAIANPEHAPYGQAAVQAMQAAGLLAQVQPRLVLGENVSQALQYVQTGNADIGVVALSLAVAPTIRSQGRYQSVPAYLHRPIRQAVGVTTRAAWPDLARRFVAAVNGPTGRPVMRAYGFALPGEGL